MRVTLRIPASAARRVTVSARFVFREKKVTNEQSTHHIVVREI